DAVEQALKNLHIPVPPTPPTGGAVPSMPIPPAPPVPPTIRPIPPVPPVPPTVGPIPPLRNDEEIPAHEAEAEQVAHDINVNVPEVEASEESGKEEDTSARANPEQEREAILRMIAEGR